jgi:hypothetical protein
MISIDSYLRKKGYRPDSSGNKPKYIKNLEAAVGLEKAKKYFDWFERTLQQGQFSEEAVWKYVGDDPIMMKSIISSQIKLSMICLEEIVEILGRKPKGANWNILELGGSDGWAAGYLKEYYDLKGEVVNIDRNPFWGRAEDFIDTISCDYSEFQSEKKYDLIFSILGARVDECEGLLSCISRHAKSDSLIVLALRIANESALGDFYDMASKYSLFLEINQIRKTTPIGAEAIPVIVLSNEGESSHSHKLRLQRNFSYKLSRPKRVVNSEAQFLYEIIKEGRLVHESFKTYDNGKATIHVFDFNGIDFMVWINPSNDIVIDYPILPEEYMNGIEYMEESCTTDKQWYFPKI